MLKPVHFSFGVNVNFIDAIGILTVVDGFVVSCLFSIVTETVKSSLSASFSNENPSPKNKLPILNTSSVVVSSLYRFENKEPLINNWKAKKLLDGIFPI